MPKLPFLPSDRSKTCVKTDQCELVYNRQYAKLYSRQNEIGLQYRNPIGKTKQIANDKHVVFFEKNFLRVDIEILVSTKKKMFLWQRQICI